jgi:hypothetical protein
MANQIPKIVEDPVAKGPLSVVRVPLQTATKQPIEPFRVKSSKLKAESKSQQEMV